MVKCFVKLLIFMLLSLSLVRCDDGDIPEQVEPMPDSPTQSVEVEGYWYMSFDEAIYTLDVRIGTAILREQVYTGSEWESFEQWVVYTISGSDVVVQIDGSEAWRAKVAVTGDRLSISNEKVAYIFSRYDGLDESLTPYKEKIEEEYVDDTPENSIVEDEIASTEIDAILAMIYAQWSDAVFKQLNLENIRLYGVDLDGVPMTITPTLSNVEEVWAAYYMVVNSTNIILQGVDREQYEMAYSEALAIKAYLYYNLVNLFGVVVEYQDVGECEVYNSSEVVDMIVDMLNDIDSIEGKEYRLSNDDVSAFAAELALYCSASEQARVLLDGVSADFRLYPEALNGMYIDIYSAEICRLLMLEAEDDMSVLEQWPSPHYGYWAMLKRTERACEVSGCEAYELLMPIPIGELLRNANLAQNEGYDR